MVVAALVAFSSLGLQGSNRDGGRTSPLISTKHQARKTNARAARHRARDGSRARARWPRVTGCRSSSGCAAPPWFSRTAPNWATCRVTGLSTICPAICRVHSSTAISDASTAADQTRAGNALLAGLLGIPGVDGQGIGVAIIDSGIAPHSALAQPRRRERELRHRRSPDRPMLTVTARTSPGSSPATRRRPAASRRSMPAASRPARTLVNVRVLGADGSGYTSDVIDGIEWVVANRARYNIRVINLSLGHPVTEACSTDPLCEAVNQAVQAGIVVVVAAGNAGKAPDGRAMLGRHFVAGELSLCDHGRRAEHVGNGRSIGRHRGDVQLSRSYGVRPRREARPGRARHEDPLAAGRRCVPAGDLSVDSRRGRRQQRLHVSERDQHGGADGQRWRRAAPAGIAGPVSGAGEVRAAERRDGHDRRQA